MRFVRYFEINPGGKTMDQSTEAVRGQFWVRLRVGEHKPGELARVDVMERDSSGASRPIVSDVLHADGERIALALEVPAHYLWILRERRRQDSIHGEGQANIVNRSLVEALPVLIEEVGELARAIIEKHSSDRLREELVQIAAVAVAMLEAELKRHVKCAYDECSAPATEMVKIRFAGTGGEACGVAELTRRVCKEHSDLIANAVNPATSIGFLAEHE